MLARRVGPADVTYLNRNELELAQDAYLERVSLFYEQLAA